MEHMEREISKKAGVEKIRLWVNVTQKGAIGLYKSLGFKSIRTYPVYARIFPAKNAQFQMEKIIRAK